MLEYAQEVYSFKQHLADKYRAEFDLDQSYSNAVVYALTSLSAGANTTLLPQGLLQYGEQLEGIVNELEIRNT